MESQHYGKRKTWKPIHLPVDGIRNRAGKEDSANKDKFSRQFSDSMLIYWFCRKGSMWPVLRCQVQINNDFNCFPKRKGGIPQLLVYFLKIASFAHAPRKSAQRRIRGFWHCRGTWIAAITCVRLKVKPCLTKLSVDTQRDLKANSQVCHSLERTPQLQINALARQSQLQIDWALKLAQTSRAGFSDKQKEYLPNKFRPSFRKLQSVTDKKVFQSPNFESLVTLPPPPPPHHFQCSSSITDKRRRIHCKSSG